MMSTPELQKTVRTPPLISPVTAAVAEDCQLSIEALAIKYGTFISTIHIVLHEDLGLEKKFARWVHKLLSDD
jgi:hypothetical protein